MKKFKLINNKTKEETICSLVTIDEFDYYVNDNEIIQKDFYIDFRSDGNKLEQFKTKEDWVLVGICDSKKVITTNNPNIDIPKVIDEVKTLSLEYTINKNTQFFTKHDFENGYRKAKETYHFTVQDMLDFGKYCINNQLCKEENRYYQYWELLQIFKEQQIKTIFYE